MHNLQRWDLWIVYREENSGKDKVASHVTTGVAVEGGIRSAIVVGYETYEAKFYKRPGGYVVAPWLTLKASANQKQSYQILLGLVPETPAKLNGLEMLQQTVRNQI
ncbi:hypothetical protein C5167_050945 [Papaver somniferum]|uniref:Uncharacterized protein n=1 Tax=Papaver somniferum TaxID=3469 RepID=A0A4Y7KQ47_PAPSO|nr:hypothetical protein C5167_050945 [Papaver somniferum]